MSGQKPSKEKVSPNDIAGMNFLLKGTREEKAKRFQIILDEENIIDAVKPSDSLIKPTRRIIQEKTGKVVSDEVIDTFDPADGGKDQVVFNAFNRIEGRDIDIIKKVFLPGAVTRTFLELKSVSENLSRYHKNMEPDRPVNRTPGTVYFELYQQSNNGFSAGSLLQWYFPPDPVNEDRQIEVWNDKAKHVTPHYVLFLLFADAMKDEGKEQYTPDEIPAYPVATIAFKWDELKTRLNEITGGKFATPGEMPNELTNDEAQKMNGVYWHDGDIIKGTGKKTGVCWYVPLDRLQDIATVTIIGNPDRAMLDAAKNRSTKGKPEYMNIDRMEQRLNYLKEQAKQEDGSIRRI